MPWYSAAIEFLVGGMMSLTTWWMDHQVRLTADQVNEIYLKLALHGLP